MGTLHFSYVYKEAEEQLEVDVLQAEKLMSGKKEVYRHK